MHRRIPALRDRLPALAGASLVLLLALSGCAHKGPAPVESRELASAAHQGKAAGRPATYRVVRGDTLYAIAWRYDLDFRRLAEWNQIDPPYRIFPDQSLRLAPPTEKRASRTPVRPAAPRLPKTRPPAPARQKGVSAPAKPAGRKPVRASHAPKWIWPTQGKLVQTFRSGDRTRQGIRIAGTPGQPIVAAESGRVVYSGSGLPGYGQLIIIKHENNYLSAYGFNRKIIVRDSDRVARGQRVAEMGRAADGTPLLHFEIRRSDTALDPLRFLPSR
jgi:lipoprotein NlpD